MSGGVFCFVLLPHSQCCGELKDNVTARSLFSLSEVASLQLNLRGQSASSLYSCGNPFNSVWGAGAHC